MVDNRTEELFKALTGRELEMLHLLTLGLSNKEIAKRLNLASGTVRIYLSNVYSKIEVNTRTQAVLVAMKRKM